MIRAALVAALLAGGCRASELSASRAVLDGAAQTNFADLLVAFVPGDGGSAPEMGELAIGAPDGRSVRLGEGGLLTIGFVARGVLVDQLGNDVRVHGAIASGGTALAYLSSDGVAFRMLGQLCSLPMELDLANANSSTARYLRLVAAGNGSAVDIDAIEVLAQ